LFLNGKKGISGLQLQREIGVTYKTAWRILKQIRIAMGNDSANRKMFEAIVEIDETYVGGKPRKRSKRDNDKKNPRGRGTKKTPVVGIVDRDSKQVYARVALPNREGKKLTGKQLLSIIDEACATNATVISDEFKSYRILESARSNRFHVSVNHSVTYGTKDIHTNNIESFWATLKRGVFGIYHHVSVKYLQNYVNEFSFRHNSRKKDIFSILMAQTIGA
jgi:transposase-like protein